MNIFEILNTLRREGLVDFVAIHPQLCADDGDNFLSQIAKDGNSKKFRVEFAGIFADDGISGTNTKNRDEFNRMIDECMAGKLIWLLPNQ